MMFFKIESDTLYTSVKLFKMCTVIYSILKSVNNKNKYTKYVTSWDKISRMSQFFHMELNTPGFRPHPALQIGEN